VGIITTIKSKELINKFKGDGWKLRSVKCSHNVFIHPDKTSHICVSRSGFIADAAQRAMAI
jgi:predicted RNA binding protein YcfA (HicA-like mRNA interferase family)